MNQPIIILGAGLTGLGAARQLPGAVVYDAKAHPGGHAYSHPQGGLHFDEGAHICHAKEEGWKRELFANAGKVVSMTQSQVANYWHGIWVTYPVQNHLRDLPPDLRIRILTEIIAAQRESSSPDPMNYAAWCRNQYGEELTERFYREYTDKYWRTPMEEMDVDWLAGRLLPSQIDRIIHGAIAPMDEKQSVFSSFHYPAQGGFFSFFKPWYDEIDLRLNKHMVAVAPGSREVRFSDGEQTHYDHLISTLPLPTLIAAMDEVPDAIRRDASTLRHTQMLGVNIIVNKPHLVPYHWFYIYDEEIEVSRVKVMSNVIPGSMPPGTTVLQTEIFRRDDEVMDIQTLKTKAVMEMASLLGFDPDKDVAMVDHVEVSHAYTIPTLGRQATVDRICAWLEEQGIVTAGLYGRWKYVWSDQAYAAGKEAAERLNYGTR